MMRKAESIYTSVRKNCSNCKKQKAVSRVHNSVRSFEESMRRNAASKVCYVYINGISMPVLA
ncbi:MAG: hypothetical protein K1W10_03060 [Lachnospiraceae bacterium]